MVNEQIQQKMDRLIRVLEAGENGYAISALNVRNRGLKALFKSYAQQRARFKTELLVEMECLGMEARPRSSIIAALHRGRINIFASLTIGQEHKEQVVLKEILFGEKMALQAYAALSEDDLPPDTMKLISRQQSEIHRIMDQIQFMRGKEGSRMVLRLFDTDRDFETALRELKNAGLRLEAVIWLNFKDVIEFYEGRTSLVSETVFTGAVGGAFYGGLIGGLSGVSMQIADIASLGALTGQGLWPLWTLTGVIVGSLSGAFLGLGFSIGVTDKDAYLYTQSIKSGKIILLTIVDALQASEVGRIMTLVNARAKAQVE